MNQERTKRKLSGILSADVVGYSRLMEKDEEYTIRCLEENKKLIGELIEEYKGRVVDAPGDNILAEFASVVNAVDCAVKIQDKIQEKNAELPESIRMYFRIGVNLGDIIDEDGRIYGDGVNIAARIEGLAEPGFVCISRTAYEQVKSKLKLGYEYLGEYNLKNITEPVRVYRVLTKTEDAGKVIGEKRFLGRITRRTAMSMIIVLFLASAGSIGWIIYSRQSGKMEPTSLDRMVSLFPNITPIAVLPFENLSEDKDQENFSEGLTGDIITGLSKHPDLLVTPGSQSTEPEKTNQAGEIPGKRYELRGTVQWEGNRVRINARLIETTQGHNIIIWTESYDRVINNNTFAIQSEIKWRIFREIRIRLIDMNQTPDFLPVYRSDIEYTEKFHLLYRYYETMRFDPRRVERLKEALGLANELINIKPDPWVYYMKGSILIALGDYKDDESEDPETVASEAEKLDKGAGLGIRGQIYVAKFERLKDKNDLEKALEYYEQWIEYDPNSCNARFGAGFTFLLKKRYDEAVKQYETGLSINPNPESRNFVSLGIAYSRPSEKGFSNLEKAISSFRKALRPPNQNNFQVHLLLTLLYTFGNQMEQARFQAREMLRIRPFFSIKYYQYRSWPSTDEVSDKAITRLHKELLKKAGLPEERNFFNFLNE
jgi:adenylate cyclase